MLVSEHGFVEKRLNPMHSFNHSEPVLYSCICGSQY
jgi:hypothetical protein